MTKLPLAQSAQPFKMTLEAAVFDWRSMRVQFGLGFAFTLIFLALVFQEFFATRFLPQDYVAVERLMPQLRSLLEMHSPSDWSTNPIMLLQVLLFKHHAWWYRAVTFAATAFTALTAGLITLDISIRYGNRIGAAAAVFTALLCATMPLQSSLLVPMDMLPVTLSNLLALYAVFLEMRFRLLRETRYFWVALLSLVLAGVCDVRGAVVGVLGIALCRLLITENDNKLNAGPLRSYIGLTLFFLAALIFLATHLTITVLGAPQQAPEVVQEFLNPLVTGDSIGVQNFGKSMQRILPILFATIFSIGAIRLILGSVWLRPLVFAGSWLLSLLAAWQVFKFTGTTDGSQALSAIFLGPPFCILLSLSALPAIDCLTRKSRIWLTALGAVVLSAVIFCWGLLLVVQLHDSFESARELMNFKLQLAHRMEKTDGKLVVINPPFESSKELEAVSEHGISTEEIPAIRDREEKILLGLLDSPLNSQVIPTTARRRQIYSFVRLARTEHATPDPTKPATSVTDYYVWSNELRRLMPLYYVGASEIKIDINSNLRKRLHTEPKEISKIPANEWEQLPSGQGYIERLEDGLGLYAGDKDDLLVWFPHELLDPTKTNLVKVRCSKLSGSRKTPAYLIFKGVDSDDTGVIQLHAAGNDQNGDAIFEATTRGAAEWTRHSSIESIGVKLPSGSQGLVLKSIETTRGASHK